MKNKDVVKDTMMQSTPEQNATMKAPTLVGIVIALHVLAVSAFIFIQGCGTVQQRPVETSAEAPPAPVMPPKTSHMAGKKASPFKPPVAVAATPSAAVQGGSLSHVIAKGETLSRVAKKYGVSTKELIGLNNIANPNRVSVGQKLIIPAHGSLTKAMARPSVTPKPKPTVKKVKVSDGNVHVVQSGDVLSKIAKKYGTTVRGLREANALSGDLIVVGQKLTIPQDAQSAPAVSVVHPEVKPKPAAMPEEQPVVEPSPEEVDLPELIAETPAQEDAVDAPPEEAGEKPILYTVVQGDTIEEIAKLFIVSRQDIMRLNDLDATAELKPGQKLKIPPSAL